MALALTWILAVSCAVVCIQGADEKREIFSLKLARQEGYELSPDEEFVDLYANVMFHIITNGSPFSFEAESVIEFLMSSEEPKNKFADELRTRLDKMHQEERNPQYDISELDTILAAMTDKHQLNVRDDLLLMAKHELYDDLMNILQPGKKRNGETASGEKGHLKGNDEL